MQKKADDDRNGKHPEHFKGELIFAEAARETDEKVQLPLR